MKNLLAGLAGSALLAGCTTAVAPPVRLAPGRVAMPGGVAGLERVMGRNAAGLTALLGKPAADFREGAARTPQFQGPICEIGRGSCRARVWTYGEISVVAVSLKKKHNKKK